MKTFNITGMEETEALNPNLQEGGTDGQKRWF